MIQTLTDKAVCGTLAANKMSKLLTLSISRVHYIEQAVYDWF